MNKGMAYNSLHSHRCIRRIGTQPCCEGLRIPRLHKDCSRPSEFADQTFASHHVRHNAARCNALEDVLAVPRNEVTVVDDVLLVFLQLIACQSKPP